VGLPDRALDEGLHTASGASTSTATTCSAIGRSCAFPLRAGSVYNDTLAKSAIKKMEDDYGERGYFYVSIDPQLQKHEKVVDLRIDVTEDRKYYVDRSSSAATPVPATTSCAVRCDCRSSSCSTSS